MIIAEHEASTFNHGNTRVMVQIYGPSPAQPKMKLLDNQVAARAKYSADRSLLDGALR